MIKEFNTNPSTFNTYITVLILIIVASIVFYATLGVYPAIILPFVIFWSIIAFWSKDRVIITMHEDYIEAKEAIAAKKKLIRYTDISNVKEHRTGKLVTVFFKSEKRKKEAINLTTIKKEERKEFIELLTAKIS